VVITIPVARVIEIAVDLVMQQPKHEAGPTVVSPRVDVKAEMQQVLGAHEFQLKILVPETGHAPPAAPVVAEADQPERTANC